MRRVGQKMADMIGAPLLPRFTRHSGISTSHQSRPDQAQSNSLHMLALMRHNRYRRMLYQDPVETINTDKNLFLFMGTQIAQRRGALRNLFSCTRIEGIRFLKVSSHTFHGPTNTPTDLDSVPSLAELLPRLLRRWILVFIVV
jgi:hypothetical protein